MKKLFWICGKCEFRLDAKESGIHHSLDAVAKHQEQFPNCPYRHGVGIEEVRR